MLSLLSCGDAVCSGDAACNGDDCYVNAYTASGNRVVERYLVLMQLPALRWFSAGEKAFSHVEYAVLESECVEGL